ncbi:ATP-binding protein [Agromyces sp. GXS1127]|uniref:ATP-binding protein n=1 Tax=Agromyces sp. GXS1127 TaxID=3424181 RepID=UPI003D31D1A5
MSTAIDVRALSSRVRIELDDSLSDAEQAAISAHWADLAWDGGGEPDRVLRAGILADGAPLDATLTISANSPHALAQRITSQVTLEAIGGLRGEALMLHAAAVALDDGRVIGFIGPSGRGKTTAAQELGRAFGYVTDETLAVRADGSIIPYPKPLSIVTESGVKATESASGLGLTGLPQAELQLAALVLLDRRPEVSQPSVESVPMIEALPELVAQSSFVSALDRPLGTLIDTVRRTGGVRRVVYSEAASIAGLVDDLLATVEEPAPVVLDVAGLSQRDCDCAGKPVDEAPGGSAHDVPGAYWRGAFVDAKLVDDALVVLASGRLTVLAGVGPALWLAADGLSEDELKAAANADLPAPPPGVDVDGILSEALSGLVDAGILARS